MEILGQMGIIQPITESMQRIKVLVVLQLNGESTSIHFAIMLPNINICYIHSCVYKLYNVKHFYKSKEL